MALSEVSSESRRYIPIAFLRPNVVPANTVQIIVGATLYHFGILNSEMHMAWVRVVAGRLESRLRYTPSVYNNYPWPQSATEKQRAAVETAAKQVLEVRDKFLKPAQPGAKPATLAD